MRPEHPLQTRPGTLAVDVLPGLPAPRTPSIPKRLPLGEMLVERGAVGPDEPMLAAYEQDLGDHRKIGEILVASGRLTREQLEQALAAQARVPATDIDAVRSGAPRRLARILVDLGVVDEGSVHDALARQHGGDARRLGDLLVAEGKIAHEDVDAALALQEQAADRGLPQPPSDDEKHSYAGRGRWLLPLQWLAFGGAALSMVRFATTSSALYPLLATFAFTALYFLVSLNSGVSGRGRFDLEAHERLVAGWRPERLPSVDVFLPSCGEDLAVLENTWRHVQAMEYAGQVSVFCLDDAGRPEVAELAGRFGFTYLSRPTREFKKAGNLRYAFERSSSDFIVVFDADFAPRTDFLRELLPYADDPAIGIVQSPQYFDVLRSQSWLQRGAGAVQELFYRHIQQGRDAAGAPICVGSNAVYRRSAMQAIGGPVQIEHSEDVHTGFRLMARGFRTRYVPLPLAKGLCPSGLRSFFNQQYRWCSGSMSLVGTRAFWRTPMTLRQRACFVSGFVYYVHTALWTFIGPLPALLILWFFPELVAPRNYIPLIPAAISLWIAFPLWHRARYPRLAAERVRLVYGWAHLFALADTMLGRTQEWAATGDATTRGGRFLAFRRAAAVWGAALTVALFSGLALRMAQGYPPAYFLPLAAYATLLTYQWVQVQRAAQEPRAKARHAASPVAVPGRRPQTAAGLPALPTQRFPLDDQRRSVGLGPHVAAAT